MRIAEVDLHASIDPKLRMLGQLCSLVPRQRSPQLLRQGRDRARDGVAYRRGTVARECRADRIKAANDRLVALKNNYDPTNLFRHNQNIRPIV